MISWSDFIRLFSESDGPDGSKIGEMFEFLQSQDQDTLPQDLKELVKWKKKRMPLIVSTLSSNLSEIPFVIIYIL